MTNEARTKPPLGLRPQFIVMELRAAEIVAAMKRYDDADTAIPQEWREELNEVNNWLADHGYQTHEFMPR